MGSDLGRGLWCVPEKGEMASGEKWKGVRVVSARAMVKRRTRHLPQIDELVRITVAMGGSEDVKVFGNIPRDY